MTEDEEPELAPYLIEAARSSRSKCRTCRKKIEKDKLRLGILLEGPYGTGYLWHHLTCAAKRRAEDVEEAYQQEAWADGVEVPPLDELRALREKAEKAKAERKLAPYVERDPSGRAKCKSCGEAMTKGDWRVALLREVSFGQQVRSGAILVHPRCVSAEIRAEDCATELDGFEEAVRANSRGVDEEGLADALAAIGPLDG
jgi:hypothetical protein